MSENLRFSTTSFLLLKKKKSTHFLPSWKSLFKRGNFEIVLLVKCISARFWLVSKKVGILFLHHWSCLPEWCISHQICALPFLIICPNMSSQSGQQTLGIYPSNSLIFENIWFCLLHILKSSYQKLHGFEKCSCSIWNWPAYFFSSQITHCQIEKLQSQREVTMMTPDICISYQKCNNYHEKNWPVI